VRKVFLLAAALWLVLNLITLTGYPAVWVDEIQFADPGIHLALGKGFVSAAWFNQPSTEFWASYTPLYSFLLAGWLKVFGISSFAVRSFSLALVTASLLMVWLALKRFADESQRWRIILALAVCQPIAFLERAGRPDSLSLLLLTATALVFLETSWRWRSVALFLLGVLAVPSAIQYAAYVLVLAVLLQIFFKPFARRDLGLWTTGAASGAAILALIYASHQLLMLFIEVTLVSKQSTIGRLLQHVVLRHGEAPFVFSDILTAPFRDYATPILIASGIAIWWFAKRQQQVLASKLAAFGVACAILIPLAIQLLGKYPLYYAYMGALPATIAIVLACGHLKTKTRLAQTAILAFLLFGGAGRFWWKAWQQGAQTIPDPSSVVSPEDTVVADYPAYYQLIGHTRELFAIAYASGKLLPHFPPEQGSQVTKLLVRDSMFQEVAKRVGGQWQRSGDLSNSVVIDDDTYNPETEAIGIYVRVGGNKNFSAPAAR